MAKQDSERDTHTAWLGLIQPVGLVVSPPALLQAQVVPDRNVYPLQQALEAVVDRPAGDDGEPLLLDVPRFFTEVLGWAAADLAGAPGGPALPDALCVPLVDHGETLRPNFVALDGMGDGRALLLVHVLAPRTELDAPPPDTAHGWVASPQARFERLLRDTGVPAGLLLNGTHLRMVYAPRGESSGHLGFPVAEMCTVGGRPLLAALHMLLSEHRVFGAPDGQRLLDLLAESRKYQSEVSNRLSEQVLGALWELLRGFQAADEAANGRVLHDLARTDPQQIYGGVLTVIMRLVFLLYAEDQGLMPDDPVYARNYAIGGLYERLREDAGRHPDTMDQRFGAWAWLLSTFRMVFDGGGHGGLRLPTRHGQLFNPDSYPFLEGRPPGVVRVLGETFDAPRVPDGVLWRVLEGLLVLDGERLSYRGLDVEQVGSVYESMMGFDVRTLPGRALAVRPKNVVIDLDALLAVAPAKRAAWLKEHAECDLAAGSARDLAAASTAEDVVAALGRRVAPQTPRPLPPGALFLQPGEERRRSGSHYTPRELTAPIVRTTLRPVLEALGPRPTPEQVLELKVCDPAMGSGAFLVESCRQLAEALVAAWEAHGSTPKLPPDEDPLLHARRLVAQRCLYGVDKNPFAVNLAKLSLWLVTLARDHAFTFLDHALKHGDSLVGYSRLQILAFNPSVTGRVEETPMFRALSGNLGKARDARTRLQKLGDDHDVEVREAYDDAERALAAARMKGDLLVAAFFGADKDKAREALRRDYADIWDAALVGDAQALSSRARVLEELREGERPVPAFHWEVEFPEVFDRPNPGFDAFVGNPPFLGGKRISTVLSESNRDWLAALHVGASSNTDLVAHFYRRAFTLLRAGGTLGLIATNTIAQGDTRAGGLRWICTHGGSIYAATRRVKWPGLAAVVVSVVHVTRGAWTGARMLDGREVPTITAFLFHAGGHDDPHPLHANASKSFVGAFLRGMGFTFDDTDASGVATPLAEMRRLIEADPRNAERIFPYIGGEEVNSSPTHAHHRYVINFGELSEEDARRWPALMEIVERKVRPERARLSDSNSDIGHKLRWWQYGRSRPELHVATLGLEQVLVTTLHAHHFGLRFWPVPAVFSHGLAAFSLSRLAEFCAMQSQVHEMWARFFGSSLGDALRYTPSDCFETFPFPPDWESNPALEAAGQTYHDFRADLMVRNNEGLTKTYNRFHDPDERSPDILRLRELHTAMDRAVLDAYGWADIPTDCDFLLDYAIDEATWGDKKKPWRYRWPDAVRDEVLARLLALNQERHEEEVRAGALGKTDARGVGKPRAKPAQTGRAARQGRGALFGRDNGEAG
jgi:hypothetical protein